MEETNIKNTHPGHYLAAKMKEMAIGTKEFAVRTSKPEKTVIAILKGESAITPDMAVAFEPVTNTPASFWMNAQCKYDECQARIKRRNIMALGKEWANKFPIDELVERKWISNCRTEEETVEALLSFFGFSTPKSWEDYYLNQKLKIEFNFSLRRVKNPYSISAWVRYGEIQAMATPAKKAFNIKLLRNYLPLLKSVMANEREEWFEELKELCENVGLQIIIVPDLPDAPITCLTRWINDTPVIQLANMDMRYDIFWKTFFHAVGHILQGGKKDVYPEGIDWDDMEMEMEMEADKFASEILLPKRDERWLIKMVDRSPGAIADMAEFLGTHPSIIMSYFHMQENKFLASSPYYIDE